MHPAKRPPPAPRVPFKPSCPSIVETSAKEEVTTQPISCKEEQQSHKTVSASSSNGASMLSNNSPNVSARTPTSSKTRLEMEELKRELAIVKASARTVRLNEISEMVRAAQELDLAFLFDATSSMQPYMDIVKDRILKIAYGISRAYPESVIRLAFVFYRDYADQEICGFCDFTSSFGGSGSIFVDALARVDAKGGADIAEDVFSGLEALAKLSWKSHNRVVYHMADAPCHGTRFHEPIVSDDYPRGDLRGRDIASLLGKLRQECKLSTYTFLHITNHTRKMLMEFKKAVGDAAAREWIREDEFTYMDVEGIPSKVIFACTATISHSLSTISTANTRLSSAKFVPREIRPALPDWNGIAPQEGQIYKLRWYGKLDTVLRHIEKGTPLELEKTQSVEVRVGLYPFSDEGTSRWPFYAQIVTHEFETKVVVLKRFKDRLGGNTGKLHSKDKYIEQMEVQAVSAQLAQEFNQCTRNIPEATKVAFTVVSALRVQSGMYYNMEKLLSGLWIRFSNNAGYVNDTGSLADTLQAFSHWTHHRSKGMVMVTDLQGVQIASLGTGAFLLCDPAIHSRDILRFTRTNLGEKGFELFYKSHKCNVMCHKLGLKQST